MRRKWPAVFLLALALAPFTLAGDGDLKKAAEAYKKQDYKAAREHAAAAIKADPKQQDAHLLLGLACLGMRDNAAAVDALTELIKLNPKLAFARDRRGDAYLKLGKFQEAVEDFDAEAKGIKVEIVSADHQNKPDVGSNIARQWYDVEGVDAIFDLTTSSVALADGTSAPSNT